MVQLLVSRRDGVEARGDLLALRGGITHQHQPRLSGSRGAAAVRLDAADGAQGHWVDESPEPKILCALHGDDGLSDRASQVKPHRSFIMSGCEAQNTLMREFVTVFDNMAAAAPDNGDGQGCSPAAGNGKRMPMGKVTIRDHYQCSEDTFWEKVFFDVDFNRRLFVEHLQFDRWEVTEHEEDEDGIRRIVEVVPTTAEVPAARRKVAGGSLGFREEGTFDRKARRHRFRVITSRLGDKLRVEGEIYVEPRGENTCERVVELSVNAKIFGIGGMLERRIIADIEMNYHKAATYANRVLG